jgi:virulence-associated protein VagC
LVLRPLRSTWQEYFERGRRFSDDFPEVIEDLPLGENVSW